MKRRREGGEKTFETVRARYDHWSETRPPRAEPNWQPSGHEPSFSMPKIIFSAIGVGIGVLLLVLAIVSFYTAWSWSSAGREAAAIGYAVIGTFLLVAGIGGVAAVLNHNFRVLSPDRRESHAHL